MGDASFLYLSCKLTNQLNHEPVRRVVGDSTADFTSEFLKSGHAVHLAA